MSSETEESETKQEKRFWTVAHSLVFGGGLEFAGGSASEAVDIHNTATGVIVSSATIMNGTANVSKVFIPGEHWDAKAGEFVAIGRGPLHRIPS